VAALAAYLALYPAAGAALVAAVSRRSPSIALALAPVVWTGLEGLRGVLLSGFPWGDLPQALWQLRPALALAPWVGIDGTRLLVAGIASGFAWGLARFAVGIPVAWPALLPCGVGAGAWLMLLAFPLRFPPSTGAVSVGVVQGNIDQAQKWDPAYKRSTITIYSDLSRDVSSSGVDLILWPETAAPFYAQEPGSERDRLESLARELGTHLAFGAPAYEREPPRIAYRNAVFLMDPEGRLTGRYDKVQLVPFGEYVPLGRFLPFLKKLAEGAGDFTAGERVEPLGGSGFLPALGPLVCFEVIFPWIASRQASQGAQVLAVVTNDAWFGSTPGPHQHLAFAAWRAAETGLPLVRAANTGVSAAFDASGQLLRATDLEVRDSFAVQLDVRRPHRTPQHRVRPWITPGALALAGFALFAILRVSRSRESKPT
jgi:apolipoprotein N-acyltransferase